MEEGRLQDRRLEGQDYGINGGTVMKIDEASSVLTLESEPMDTNTKGVNEQRQKSYGLCSWATSTPSRRQKGGGGLNAIGH